MPRYATEGTKRRDSVKELVSQLGLSDAQVVAIWATLEINRAPNGHQLRKVADVAIASHPRGWCRGIYAPTSDILCLSTSAQEVLLLGDSLAVPACATSAHGAWLPKDVVCFAVGMPQIPSQGAAYLRWRELKAALAAVRDYGELFELIA